MLSYLMPRVVRHRRRWPLHLEVALELGGCVGARTLALDRFHGDGGAGGGDHEHIALAEHLVIHIDAHDGVGAQRRGALLQLVEGLGARHHQLLLVTCRSAADEVANAGAEILQEVDAGDYLAEDDAVVALDILSTTCGNILSVIPHGPNGIPPSNEPAQRQATPRGRLRLVRQGPTSFMLIFPTRQGDL